MIRRRIVYVILLYLILNYNVLYRTYDGFVMLVLLAALPLFSFGVLICQRFFVSARFDRQSQRVRRKEDYEARLVINNPTIFPVVGGIVYFDRKNRNKRCKFAIEARDKIVLFNKERDEYCGFRMLTVSKIYLYDFFRMFRVKIKCSGVAEITILPRLFDVSEDLTGTLGINDTEDNSTLNRRGEDNSEIVDIRDYMDGDTLKRVHQKLSCRMDKLMVKEYGHVEDCEPEFIIRLGSSNDAGQHAINDMMSEAMYAVMLCFIKERKTVHGAVFGTDGKKYLYGIDRQEKLDDFFAELIAQQEYMGNVPAVDRHGVTVFHFFDAVPDAETIRLGFLAQEAGDGTCLYIPKERKSAVEECGVPFVTVEISKGNNSADGGERLCLGQE